VLSLVLGEALLLCLSAAAAGLALAVLAFPQLKSVIGVAQLPPLVLGEGLALAALLAIVTGLVPALKVRRLAITDALAGR
jgi:putative ABC transport system permease protein